MIGVKGQQVHHRDHPQVIHQALKVQPQVIPLTAVTTSEETHTFDYGDSPYGTVIMMTRHQIHANGHLQYHPGEEHPKVVDQVRRDRVLTMMIPRSPRPQRGFQEQPSGHLLTNALQEEPHSKKVLN